uniref:Uncharacterized protein n=1 Tax=Solanum lycopersicum TaxID=4081 RepID=A0A3Q7I3S3_SOLLC
MYLPHLQSILSIKKDGTFNQEHLLQYLRFKRSKSLASSIVTSFLGLNTFLVSEEDFLTGQPLGYYGSWSLFSLSHQYIVSLETLKAYPLRSTLFVYYALLCDYILITNMKVVNQYSRLLDRLSVTISFSKSIVS